MLFPKRKHAGEATEKKENDKKDRLGGKCRIELNADKDRNGESRNHFARDAPWVVIRSFAPLCASALFVLCGIDGGFEFLEFCRH